MTLREGLSIGARRRLFVGGCDTVELANMYGTPLYVMDEASVRKNCRAFVRAMAEHAPEGSVYYASKALCVTAILRMAQQEGLGVDVVSGGELQTALQAGIPMDKVIYHGNVKTEEELAMAVRLGVGRLVVDSLDEIQPLQQAAQREGRVQSVLLRINPGVDAHTHRAVQTARTDCKFGMGIDDGEALRAIKLVLACKNLRLTGLHTHIGSQLFSMQPYVQAMDKLTDFMVLATVVIGCELEELNLGGGFGARYVDEDEPPMIYTSIRYIAQTLRSMCSRKGMKPPRLMVEPGRSIVAEAGVALYRVHAVKRLPGVRTYVALDGSMADNPRPMLYQSPYTALLANRAGEPETETVALAGRACESGDVLMWEARLPQVQVGDIVAMLSAGAYQYSMASHTNRIPNPAMVLAYYGKSAPIVERERFEDMPRMDRMPNGLGNESPGRNER